MGLLDKLKKKPLILSASVKGTVVPMADIPDEVFSQDILGLCLGVDPAEGTIRAPFDGKITQLPDTFHAVGIQGSNGLEVLLHVGVDTVDMKGKGFTMLVKEGQKVKKGDHLMTMDLEVIKAAGRPTTIITAPMPQIKMAPERCGSFHRRMKQPGGPCAHSPGY